MIATFAPQLATLVFEVSKGETVRAILDRLPGNCSIDEMLDQLYLVQAVARDDTDVAAGRTESHEQVEADLRRKWLRATWNATGDVKATS